MPTPTPRAGSSTFTVAEDTFINASRASTNYGTDRGVGADNAPTVRGLLRFNVTGIPPGATITSARLTVYVRNGSDNTGSLWQVGGSWEEMTTTWDNAPSIGGFVADLSGAATVGAWIEADVTSQILGDGRYDFYLTSSSNDNVVYHSREAGNNPPTLTVDYTY